MTALFETAADTHGIEALARLHAGIPRGWTRLEDRAWEREWLKRFAPRRFGRGLWVVPGDVPPPDPSAANVLLDPGLAFGTGDHATTSLCLQWIGDHRWSGQRVLDYGCGSGVLAIAALRSGAGAATAVDIDPQALLATADNARRNDVRDRLSVITPDELAAGDFDVVVANILAAPLIELATRLVALVRRDGDLVLSGILHSQVAGVADAYADFVDWGEPRREGDWALLHGSRREAA